MYYSPTKITDSISIGNLYTIHYFEYSKNFVFLGETHDFWEILYVDRGNLDVVADGEQYKLIKDDIIFHKPNEFHSLSANGVNAPNLVVISFECDSSEMDFFEHKILRVDEEQKQLMTSIIKEARNAFSSSLDDYMLKKLEKRKNQVFACEQLVKLYTELLLIDLKRKNEGSKEKSKYYFKKKLVNSEYKRVTKYLEENVTSNVTLAQICSDNHVSRSQIQKLFKQKTGGGVVDYFIKLKVERAKEMIRENTWNFTEISLLLGYSSVHYFSRQFKSITGMNPTEYSLSVV